MKKLLASLFLLVSASYGATQLSTVFNPFTGKPDYINVGTGGGGATNGTINSSANGNVAIYSLPGSSTTLSGSTNLKIFSSSVVVNSSFFVSTETVSGEIILPDGTIIKSTATFGGGSTSPGGSDTQVQYNNSGAFGADSNFTWDKTGHVLSASGQVNSGLSFGINGSTFAWAGLSSANANVFAGLNSGSNASSIFGNTCIGNDSCKGLTSSTNFNSCYGEESCKVLSGGVQNSCFGVNSCTLLTTGSNNTVYGYTSGNVMTTGGSNTCFGNDACDRITTGNSNTVVGNTAGADIVSGARNTCMGGDSNAFQPCQGIVAGSSNTMVGAGSGGNLFNLLTGNESGNVFVSYQGGMSPGVNYGIGIGYQPQVISSNTAVIGGALGAFNEENLVVSSITTNYVNSKYSISAGSMTVTSTATVAALSFSGGGNAQFSNDGSNYYQLVGSSATATAGHLAVFSSSWSVVDGGVPGSGGGTPSGGNFDVQVSSNGAFGGADNLQNNGSTVTVSNVGSMVETNVSSQVAAGVYFDYTASTMAEPSLLGRTAGSTPSSGMIGQYISSSAVSAVSFPSTTNYGDLASISLTPGDWDISAVLGSQANGATVTTMSVGISSTTGNSSAGLIEGDSLINSLGPTAATDTFGTIPNFHAFITTTTTYYLKFKGAFSVATPKAVGRLSARRVS